MTELPRISVACERVNKQIGRQVRSACDRAQSSQKACTRREDCIAGLALVALSAGAALAWWHW